MFGKYTKLISLFAILFAMSFSNLTSKDAGGTSLYMYGAIIEATAQDDSEGGILANKEIRIINLGPIINHPGVDYAPTISADGKTLFYVSNKPGSIKTEDGELSHDFWVAKKANRMDTVFNQPYNLDPSNNMGLNGVNTVLNEGAASVAADRQSLYFTACNRPDGLGSCDIYKTSIQGDQWGRPVNLGRNVNSKNFDSQPTIAPDQSRIYFVSTRKGPNSDGEEDVKKNWEQLKLREGKKSVLSGVPRSLPAMVKAYRMQDKTKQVGFEWENSEQVWAKVEEELAEFREAMEQELPFEKREEEFGDVLFSLINYARFQNIDPETALERVNQKFKKRFEYIEANATKGLQEMSLAEMDALWEEAKRK